MSVRKYLPFLLVACAALTGCIADDAAAPPTAYAFADTSSLTLSKAKSETVEIAAAQPEDEPTATKEPFVSSGDYVVEFRARPGPDVLGHSYMVFGRLGADGTIMAPVHAGLYPKDTVTGFTFGLVGTGTDATIEPISLDRSIPPTIVYRKELTADQYARLSAAVSEARANPPSWSWSGYNCNTFLVDLARETGLNVPVGATFMAPVLFISQMRDVNESS